MRALITGATGFIGSRLALRCRREGMEVVALGRRRNPAEEERARELERAGVHVQDVPVEDLEGLVRAMQGADRVFHLAAAQHEANVPDEYFRRINVEGTRNVFEAAAKAGVGRVVQGSTIGVYAWRDGAPSGVDARLEPDNIYGVTKLEAEAVVRSFEGRVPFAIARISETYGPGDGRLLKLFKGAERGLSLQIGDGENLHHLVHVEDLLDGLLLAAREPEALGRTFVLAGPEPVSTRVMLESVARALGRRPRILRVPLAPLMGVATLLETLLRPLGIQPPLHRRRMDFFRKSFAFGASEAARFGYAPRVGLDEGMEATARWYAERGLVSAPALDTGDEVADRIRIEAAARAAALDVEEAAGMPLEARMEPFDSFWEGPEDVEKGYRSVYEFYRRNYLPYFPARKDAPILVVSCGPGYMVDMLARHGYADVVGIDSDDAKAAWGRKRGLDCRAERAFPFVAARPGAFAAIFCEQELNHLTKREILIFLQLCHRALRPGGTLIAHALNGANPITGAEALAQNFDHYNTFTEYTLHQCLEHTGFERVRVIPLNLYVFYRNPFNWVAWGAAAGLSALFRAAFILYGKSNRIFTKKIAAACRKPEDAAPSAEDA